MKSNSKDYHLQIKLIFIFLFIPLFLCHHPMFVVAESSPPFHPLEQIAIDCGSSGNGTDLSSRTWAADTTLFHLEHNASTLSTANPLPKTIDSVPYKTARLSISPFTYSFSVTKGPKFIRLYFYPASYSNFITSNSYFSVKAGRFTLLRNFSCISHARALQEEGFFREYIINVEEGQNLLNISFIPETAMPDAYAFINGIEIVSMPDNLLYSKPNDAGFPSVGPNLNPVMRIETDFALQLMHRINVGGNSISPQDDTGMFRSWSDDTSYLTVDKSSVVAYNNFTQLTYKNTLYRYAAPDIVYNTSRMMGNMKVKNINYNLTWEFPVDSNFIYIVRLYFCEFIPLMNLTGDRSFMIYMANETAEKSADVIEWSGGNGFPIYRDFAVKMESKGSEKVQNLSIALHPQSESLTAYSDAILNGLEIFKVSAPDNLAGPNPDISLSNPPAAETGSNLESNNNGKKIGAIVGGISGFLVLSLLLFFIFRLRPEVKKSGSTGGAPWWSKYSVSSSAKSGKTQSTTLPSDLCRRFSLAEIREATNNFDSRFIIGVGGFGNVYKGLFKDGAITVAIKRLNQGSKQGVHEFKTEIEMLSQLRYLHLLSLIGYCYEDEEMILVYDYMARGTLRDHLYKTDNPPLSWNRRLEICIGAARGLQYLHTGAKNTIIHRDVKSTNILLDEKWVAKVSDFGLSKINPDSTSKPHVSTVVKGSFGYLDPEYYQLQQLTEKSDVYSFGVVLCEVLSARPAVNRSAVHSPISLAHWATQCYRRGKIDEIVDPYLRGKIASDCFKKFSEVAVSCLLENGKDRPSMNDVVWGLEFALQLQETAVKHGQLQTEIVIDMESPLKGWSVDDSSDDLFNSGSAIAIGSRLSGMTLTSSSDEQSFVSNKSEKVTSGAIFSEIMNPRAR